LNGAYVNFIKELKHEQEADCPPGTDFANLSETLAAAENII
jgi:hypothetical protein